MSSEIITLELENELVESLIDIYIKDNMCIESYELFKEGKPLQDVILNDIVNKVLKDKHGAK